MYYGKFDSYYYSRPVSYRSYNPKVVRQEVLPVNDVETQEILALFKENGIEVTNLGGLARGIRFRDLEVGSRIYNHNGTLYYGNGDYYIHQWTSTNDLSAEHPTGHHYTTKVFSSLKNELKRIIADQRKTYK